MNRVLGIIAAFCLTVASSAVSDEAIANPELFPAAANLIRPWAVTLEDGTKLTLSPDQEGRFDLTRYRTHGDYGTLSTEFESPHNGIMFLGCGADWYSEIELNGKNIFSKMQSGNIYYPADAYNYIVPVAVRAGRNTLVVRTRSGDTYWIQYIRFFPPDADALKNASQQALLNLLLPAPARLNHGPWVTPCGENAYSVNFVTSHPVGGGVRYRTAGGNWQKAFEMQGGRIRTDERVHHVMLNHVKPGEKYEIQLLGIDAATGDERVLGHAWHLVPPGDKAKPLRLFVISDLHRTVAERKKLLDDYLRNAGMCQADIWISLGDFVSKTDNFEFAALSSLDILSGQSNRLHPLVMLRGNHEFRGPEAGEFFHLFAPAGEAWSLFRCGSLCIITLDAGECDAYKAPPQSHTFLNLGEEEYFERQRKWLASVVQTPEFQTASCRIVLCHGAPIATGANTYMSDHLKTLTDGIFTGSSPKERIDLWLAGHIHVFRRFNAGSVPGIPFPVLFADGPEYGGRNDSAFRMEWTGHALTVESLDRTGECFDRLVLPAK